MVNGMEMIDRGMVYKYGIQVISMMDIGRIICLMVKANFIISTETHTMGIGSKIKRKGTENFLNKMVIVMKVNG